MMFVVAGIPVAAAVGLVVYAFYRGIFKPYD